MLLQLLQLYAPMYDRVAKMRDYRHGKADIQYAHAMDNSFDEGRNDGNILANGLMQPDRRLSPRAGRRSDRLPA